MLFNNNYKTSKWLLLSFFLTLLVGCNDNSKPVKDSCQVTWGDPTFSFHETSTTNKEKLVWDKAIKASKQCKISSIHYSVKSDNKKIVGELITKNTKEKSMQLFPSNIQKPETSCSENLTLNTTVTLTNNKKIKLPLQYINFYIAGKNNSADEKIMSQYISPGCLTKLQSSLKRELNYQICRSDNSGFTTKWLVHSNRKILDNQNVNIRSPIGTYANKNLFPYANSKGYYIKGAENIFSRSIKNSKLLMDNYDSQVNGSPAGRIISWAFPPQGCPKTGCPVLILFPGGANHAMDKMQLNPSTAANINPAEMVFSDAWNWPEKNFNPKSGFDFNYGYYVRMKLLQAALKKGYAVIGLNPEINQKTVKSFDKNPWDDWSFAPQYCPNNKRPSVCTGENPGPKVCDWQNADSFLWPGSDKGFLNVFFKNLINTNKKGIIYSNYTSLVSDIKRVKGNRRINLSINTNDIFMIGYSSGAQMVSRMINEFALPFPAKEKSPQAIYSNPGQDNEDTYWLPTLNGKNPDEKTADNLLKIKGAIMLAGGSYYSYSNCPSTMPPPLGNSTACTDCQYCGKPSCAKQQSKNFFDRFIQKDPSRLAENCVLNDDFYLGYIDNASGCGSDKMLEASYQSSPGNLTPNPLATWKNHPPALLAQSNYDSYANRNVSQFYYFLMKQHDDSQNNVYRISSNNPTTGHFYFAEMVVPSINFMLKYTNSADDNCNIFSGKKCPKGAVKAPNKYASTHKNDTKPFAKNFNFEVGGKSMSEYPTDGYGKYVYCNDQELSYLGIRRSNHLEETFPEQYTYCKSAADILPYCKN